MISICDLLKITLILYGGFFLCRSVLSLAQRRMTESFCVFWTTLSLLMIGAGILLHPVGLSGMVSVEGFVLIMLGAFAILEAAYYLSKRISMLERYNRELSMQVALLLHDVKALNDQDAERIDTDEEATVIRDQYDGLRRRGNSAGQSAQRSVAQ